LLVALLQRSVIDEYIQVEEQDSLRLQVETPNITNVTTLLSELMWYHNGTVILPGPSEDNQGITFSADKKILTIANFSSADAGVYKVQFNRIDVHPYNQTCNDELISLLRGYPILAPAVYCVNVNPCTSEDPTIQRVKVRRLNFNVSDGLTLVANGMANSAEEFEHLSIKWYRNGRHFSYPNFYYTSYGIKQQRQYPTIGQELRLFESEIAYEETGRYEAALTINSDSNCRAHFGQLLAPYCRPGCYRYSLTQDNYEVPRSWGYIDVSYYKSKHLHDVILKIYQFCMHRCRLVLRH
jgi:hypothetical protein